ncbi:hypothetical protein HanXRQr2_Chr05g0196081 [Helianthus annuus]|uniref:Uncharacterized protein n=1 Tax=Helianthus annuus TaxID=4232 RepID=A0A9K3IYF7_HELAN|nr:hypothetical protein HanXRQr2_Chr05g0196081 [Helianthus annuus]
MQFHSYRPHLIHKPTGLPLIKPLRCRSGCRRYHHGIVGIVGYKLLLF